MSNSDNPIILASSSPRREAILKGAGILFRVEPSGLEEGQKDRETPEAMVKRLALEKAKEVARRYVDDEPCWVLGADTTVVVGNEILEKPQDSQDAIRMLSILVGRSHIVWSGVALVRSDTASAHSFTCKSLVEMRSANLDEIQRYVKTGEPLGKAGAYAIQGKGSSLVTRVVGSETNVIGLPLEETLELIREVCRAR